MVATTASTTTTTNTTGRHLLTSSSSSSTDHNEMINNSNNYSNPTHNKYSPKPFIVSKERFRSVSSATISPHLPPTSLLSNNSSSSSSQLSNTTTQQDPNHQHTSTTTPTIRDLNLPTVRKSRRKKPIHSQDGENPLSEEEYRRLMMLKRKSRFIYSSSMTVNSRQKENYDNEDDDEGSFYDEEEVNSSSGVMMKNVMGDNDFSKLFDNLEGQDLETQFNNFLNALQGRTTNSNSSSSDPVISNNNNLNTDNVPHYPHNDNINGNINDNNEISTMKNNHHPHQHNNNSCRHSDIPRVLMEHFQKEEFEWKQQVRQLNASREATTLHHLPDKYCQMSTFTLNNNGSSTESDLFESHHDGLNNKKLKNNNNTTSVSSTLEEQRRGQQQQYSSNHYNFNNNTYANTFASSSFSGAESNHLLIGNNNENTFNYSKPFYTTHSMMNESEYLQATSSATDYSYPMFHTDDESSLMFDDDNHQATTDSSPFEKLILDDDELLDYGDCDTYGDLDEFNNNDKTPTMEDYMDESSFFIEQTPPPQRPIYLSLQPVSPLMSATSSELTKPRKSSTSGGINSPSSSRTTNNLNNNTLLVASDELDVFTGDSPSLNTATISNENTCVTGSPIDTSRKSKVRHGSVPSEEFNKFLQISSPQQQQLFQGACSPARALSPTTSSIACSPGKVSSHHSRKMSNHGIGHMRSNSGIKKQPRANSYTVSSILGDPQLKPLFFDFLNEHHNSELVLFLQEEEEFRSECQNCIASNIGKLMIEYEIKMERIKQIFETYIKPGSNSELNLSNETRLKVENRVSALLIPPVISRHKGVGDLHLSRWISPDTFEAATTEVKISLKNHILPLFLESSRFENYLVQKHIQDNTVSNLRGKKIQRMLGYYIPESAKDYSFYVNGTTVGLGKQQQQQQQMQQPQHSQHHHYSTINDPTAKKSRPKKSLAALFGNNHAPSQNHNNPTMEQPVLNDTSPKSPFKNEQHKNQSLSKFKNWILGKRHPAESPNPSSSWSTLSKKSQLTVNNASNSSPQLVGTSSHIKISPREMESDPNKKVANAFLPLTMSSGQSNNTNTPEINSLINDGIIFIKVHTKKRGNCKILEINIDKMSLLSDQDKKLANQLKNVLLTHIDADINPFDKYPHLREFLQTKISVQSQKNWEEINEDCIIKVKSPATSNFFKL